MEPAVEPGLTRWLHCIELSYLECSGGDVVKAKKSCMEAIKILNNFAKANNNELMQPLSEYSLKLYDQILKNNISVSDRIKWLASKRGSIYPPRLKFAAIDSMNSIFISQSYLEQDEKIQRLPASLRAEFKPAIVGEWSSSRADLQNLYQDLLPNCSFVSSLLSIAQSDKTSLVDLISPRLAHTGYRVSLYFNGCWRIVSIDNQLPYLVDDESRSIIIKSYSNQNLLWPALIEKAYLKVMGQGYEFGGSNMSNDTYMLTGWLPENIRINNHSLPSNFDHLWKLKKQGHLLIGIGTGKISKELSNLLGLILNHDYVIENYDKQSNELLVKNPWIEGNKVKDRYLKIDANFGFKFLYLNWNIDKFQYHSQINFISSNSCQLRDQSQYSLVNEEDIEIEVYLLLERHLNLIDEAIMKLDIYQTTNGDKILYPNQYLGKSINSPSNSRLQLIKFTLNPHSAYTIVISSSVKSTSTINIYNDVNSNLSIQKARNLYSNIETINGNWSSQTNGGNWSLSSFIQNPQYDIEIFENMDIFILVFTNDMKSLINFHLLHSDVTDKLLPVRLFDKSKLLINENYNQNYQASNIKNLTPGIYKLIVSNYERSNLDLFTVLINYTGSPTSLQIQKTSNHLGLFTTSYHFNWNNNNRHRVLVSTSSHNTRLTFHLHLPYGNQEGLISTYVPAIRGLIFRKSNSQPILINETWNNSIYGIFVDCILDIPDVYILLVERFESGNGTVIVDVGSDKKIEFLKD